MSYVDSKSAGALHYRGSVATVDYLPQVGQQVGDMYNVEEDGQNYAWTGYKWDSQGPLINLKPLEQGIADNATAIQNEVTNRQAASNTLQANIDKEVTDRQSACNTLQTNITNEETERKSADSLLDSKIIAEKNRATGVESNLQSGLEELTANVNSKVFTDTQEYQRIVTAGQQQLNQQAQTFATNEAQRDKIVDEKVLSITKLNEILEYDETIIYPDNRFNKDDIDLLEGYTINSQGDIVSSENNFCFGLL